jgi:hypothetical protein
LEVSDPNHPSYGKHWDNDQITALVGPSKATLTAIYGWLGKFCQVAFLHSAKVFVDSLGISDRSVTRNRDFLKIKVPVKIAERMLQV